LIERKDEIRGNPKTAKTQRMKYTEKEFLEWKIDFLKDQIEEVDINRELAEGDDDYMELLENGARNVKTWIKEVRMKKKSITK